MNYTPVRVYGPFIPHELIHIFEGYDLVIHSKINLM